MASGVAPRSGLCHKGDGEASSGRAAGGVQFYRVGSSSGALLPLVCLRRHLKGGPGGGLSGGWGVAEAEQGASR